MAGARQELKKLLDGLGESSRFVTSGNLMPVLPGLEVKGLGSIGTPVSTTDAKRLITKAKQAPYGRGEKTVLDLKVRRVWQIEPARFALRNSGWDPHISSIVDAVKQEFGIHQKVSAELYKLLVYEKGGFFAPHRDSEKTPGMFATLVVCLPSRHDGGTLVVTHDGQTRKIDFGGADSEFKTHYAAFYADCQHEITPVTAGYRVCLVYNLAITGKKSQPSAPRNAPAVEKAAQLLKELFANASNDLNKIAIPFTHQYTENGLDPKQLKGADRARADVLARAAESLDYQCHLALLTHYQSGYPDESTLDYDPYDQQGSYGWSEYEDDEYVEVEASDAGQALMDEVHEETLVLDHWLDPFGHKPSFGAMHLTEDEILSQGDKAGWSVRKEIHEATGNEGVSMELWYRQGVVVIWPPERYFGILAGEGQKTALPALEEMAARRKSATSLAECRSFAKAIINHWKPGGRIQGDGSYTGRMLKLLDHVGDAELVQRFLSEVLPNDFDGAEGPALHRLFQRHGWQPFGTALRDFLAQQKPNHDDSRLPAILAICESLCCDAPELTADRSAVCASLVDELARVMDRWDTPPVAASWYSHAEKRKGVVESVVRIFATFSASDSLDRFLDRVLIDTRRYDLHQSLVPAVKAVAKWVSRIPAARPAFFRLLKHSLTELSAATAKRVDPPKDWARNADITCGCEDCRALAQFLRDPAQRVGRFPLRKDRRQHLHRQIEHHDCDCTHVTERVGSPQTLVCTKTQASYEKQKQQHDVDRALLAELQTISAEQIMAAKPSAKKKKTPAKKKTSKK